MSKSLVEILAEGHEHTGGLLQMAEAELLGGLWSAERPCTPEQRQRAWNFLGYMAKAGPMMTPEERRQHIADFRANFDRKADG